MKIKFLLVISLLLKSIFSTAQSHENDSIDSTHIEYKSLEEWAKKSTWYFHSRSYFMNTINEGALKDDFTIAQGAGIGLRTAPLKGFQMGFSGYFIFNVFSSDLAAQDKTTGAMNRYEIGQYNVTNFKNQNNLSRFEDLFLKYTYKKSNLMVGRMEMNTPFINAQDGRMRPTFVEGLGLNLKKNEKFSFSASYVWRMMPRSTFQYYLFEDATGLYSQGLNTNGTKSDYNKNIKTIGFFTSHLCFTPFKNFKINIWNGYFDNVMNTGIIEVKNEFKKNDHSSFYQALMYVRQDAVNYGGNENQNKTYIRKGAQSHSISGQFGFKNKKLNLNLNYTHITDDGRYLMPREWGRDPFYTFMSRERNEGSGGVDAISTNIIYQAIAQKLKLGIGYGYFKMPKVTDVRLNKYGMPAYHQVNISASYQFQKKFRGMELRMLAASKFKDGNEYLAPKYVYNKVNMVNLNLILDIKI